MQDPTNNKRFFYGAITVSDRGQIVIPADARRHFNIEVGDKLLVFGDLDSGLAMVKASVFMQQQPGIWAVLQANSPQSPGENSPA